jgi:hypothetical protein
MTSRTSADENEPAAHGHAPPLPADVCQQRHIVTFEEQKVPGEALATFGCTRERRELAEVVDLRVSRFAGPADRIVLRATVAQAYPALLGPADFRRRATTSSPRVPRCST